MSKNIFLLGVVLFFVSMASLAAAPAGGDSIDGAWDVTFTIAGQTAIGTFTFDVKGSTVSGTVYSEHTGAGTITEGKFDGHKLTCTLKFEKHESISLMGKLTDRKLAGTFDTEGATGTWTASRKK
jgi:hypothetical protein